MTWKSQKRKPARLQLGLILLSVGAMLLTISVVAYFVFQSQSRVFSPYTLLLSSWDKYKQKYVQQDGRVIDFSQNNITTSEGQSYAMLRAVWIDDRETFDKVWNWTKDNLKRPNDWLFGWRWGEREDSSFGLLPEGGENSASDADQDIALALILAHKRWSNNAYIENLNEILTDTWDINTVEVQGKRYLIAGNWAQSQTELILNPSYFSPYSWRIFSLYDKDHDWKSLIEPAYELLSRASESGLQHEVSANIPPNWVTLNRATGELFAPHNTELTTHYSYDAVRVPWRIALDYYWNQEPLAKSYLEATFSKFVQIYEQDNRLMSGYSHDGVPLTDYENSTMYATLLPALSVIAPETATRIYNEKILELYSSDQDSFLDFIPYYEQNWLWFGSALYLDQLHPIGLGEK